MKLPFTLSGLECGVLSHHGVLGLIVLENPIKSEQYVDMVYEFLGHLTEEKLPEYGSIKTAQHVMQHR
jgi:hypothetical protein